MPSAYAKRDQFDLSSTRAIYQQFATCGPGVAAHAPKNVVRRTGRRRRSRSDAQAPARQIESVSSVHDYGKYAFPSVQRGQLAFVAALPLDGQIWQINSQRARVDDKSSWSHFCVRRSRLRETPPWFNKKIHPSLRMRLEQGRVACYNLSAFSEVDGGLRNRAGGPSERMLTYVAVRRAQEPVLGR